MDEGLTEDRGLIIVHTGNGKGKTTAAFGLALRAAGHGMRVLVLQFLKGQKGVGIVHALSKASLPITVSRFGRPGYVHSRVCEPLDKILALEGLWVLRRAMESGDYDMIILDEINVAIYFGLLELQDVLELIREKPPRLHLVLTGRYAPKEFLEIADSITEMKEVKHHYSQGVQAQKGIEI
ncbi:MAG: cob(I)yrinic acid a,c-diamide adenosyltransferase [Thermodesulfobacteriota bacterium]